MIREMNLGMGYWTVNYTVYKITNHFFCKRGNFVHQHWGCTNVSCIVVSLIGLYQKQVVQTNLFFSSIFLQFVYSFNCCNVTTAATYDLYLDYVRMQLQTQILANRSTVGPAIGTVIIGSGRLLTHPIYSLIDQVPLQIDRQIRQVTEGQ